jgi:hypothetical protein
MNVEERRAPVGTLSTTAQEQEGITLRTIPKGESERHNMQEKVSGQGLGMLYVRARLSGTYKRQEV